MGLGAAWIASRAAGQQIKAAQEEGQRTREHADELAQRAQLQANIDRYTQWAITGTPEQALHAVIQLQGMAENSQLDKVQETAVYAALAIAHQRKFADLDGDDPPQLPGQAAPLDPSEDTGMTEQEEQ